MESRTRKNASRKEVIRSIREFSLKMSEAPEAPKTTERTIEVPAETMRLWNLISSL